MFVPSTPNPFAAGVDQTAAQRVANVKSIMARGASAPGHQQHQQQPAANGFGVDGTNMQVALYGQQQQQYPQLQMYNEATMMQQQQQMYNTMAMQQQQMVLYQSMAAQQNMMTTYNPQSLAAMQQQQMMMQQQQQHQHQMMRMQGFGRQGMGPGMRAPGVGSVGVGVPAMAAEKAEVPTASYKVQRGTKPTRVNASDQAFGPIMDDLRAKLGK
jgi:hypothetical protein